MTSLLRLLVRMPTLALGVGFAVSCGSDDENEPIPSTFEGLCDAVYEGYLEAPSCGGEPRQIGREACVAAADMVHPDTPDVSCSDLWRTTLTCAVRADTYQCSPTSGQASLPGGLQCEAEWTAYARCVGRFQGSVVDFPWHPCDLGSRHSEGCPFVASQPEHGLEPRCFDSAEEACNCACEHEGSRCAIEGPNVSCNE